MSHRCEIICSTQSPTQLHTNICLARTKSTYHLLWLASWHGFYDLSLFGKFQKITPLYKGHKLEALCIISHTSVFLLVLSSMRMCTALLFVAYFFSGLMQLAHGQAMAPSPMVNDGAAIGQGIAYVLWLSLLLVSLIEARFVTDFLEETPPSSHNKPNLWNWNCSYKLLFHKILRKFKVII